jgi:hypothetical protein
VWKHRQNIYRLESGYVLMNGQTDKFIMGVGQQLLCKTAHKHQLFQGLVGWFIITQSKPFEYLDWNPQCFGLLFLTMEGETLKESNIFYHMEQLTQNYDMNTSGKITWRKQQSFELNILCNSYKQKLYCLDWLLHLCYR